MRRLLWLGLPALLVVVLSPPEAGFSSNGAMRLYMVTDLGDLPGGTDESRASGINNVGQVAGSSVAATGGRAFLWEWETGMADLGDLPGGGDRSLAMGINDAGQVVGFSEAATGARAFLWESGKGLTDLGDLDGGGDSSGASGINDAGQVVGYSATATGLRAFLWEPGTGMTDLGDLDGGQDFSAAVRINDSGQVVGYSGAVTGYRAFLWEPGTGMTDLGDLDGGIDWSAAVDINDAGRAVGLSSAATGVHACLWEPGTTTPVDLGDLPSGGDDSRAIAINNASQVVGRNRTAAGLRAFLWESGTDMIDLNALLDATGTGWTLTRAEDINDAGQIVGRGTDPDGKTHGFLLTPNLDDVLKATFKVNFRKHAKGVAADRLTLKAILDKARLPPSLDGALAWVQIGDLSFGPYSLEVKGKKGRFRSKRGETPRVKLDVRPSKGLLAFKVSKADLMEGLGVEDATGDDPKDIGLLIRVGTTSASASTVTCDVRSKAGKRARGKLGSR